MTDAQVATLRTLLSDPNQQFVIGPVAGAVTDTSMVADGVVMVRLSGGFAQVDATGTVTSQFTAGTFAGGFTVSRGAALATLFSGVASLLLAALLLIAGVLTLRNSPRGRRLHLIYAALKIPMIILAAAASYWFMTSMMSRFATLRTAGGINPISTGLMIWFTVSAAVSLVYPIILLSVMHTRRVREFYNSVSPG